MPVSLGLSVSELISLALPTLLQATQALQRLSLPMAFLKQALEVQPPLATFITLRLVCS